jgi:hypothetical protein
MNWNGLTSHIFADRGGLKRAGCEAQVTG